MPVFSFLLCISSSVGVLDVINYIHSQCAKTANCPLGSMTFFLSLVDYFSQCYSPFRVAQLETVSQLPLQLDVATTMLWPLAYVTDTTSLSFPHREATCSSLLLFALLSSTWKTHRCHWASFCFCFRRTGRHPGNGQTPWQKEPGSLQGSTHLSLDCLKRKKPVCFETL